MTKPIILKCVYTQNQFSDILQDDADWLEFVKYIGSDAMDEELLEILRDAARDFKKAKNKVAIEDAKKLLANKPKPTIQGKKKQP